MFQTFQLPFALRVGYLGASLMRIVGFEKFGTCPPINLGVHMSFSGSHVKIVARVTPFHKHI